MARHRSRRFTVGFRSPRVADYSVASGIFNVRLEDPDDRWSAFIDRRCTASRPRNRGFAVNFVNQPPRGAWIPPGLYTTPPEPWIEYCSKHIGAEVELVKDYGMREFTLLVRPRLHR